MRRRDDPRDRAPFGRARLERRRCGWRLPAAPAIELLLHPRTLYVGDRSGVSSGLWSVGLRDGAHVQIGAPPTRAGAGEAPLQWAASALLRDALRREADREVARGLAGELTLIDGRRLALFDVEVRMWYLRYRLLASG